VGQSWKDGHHDRWSGTQVCLSGCVDQTLNEGIGGVHLMRGIRFMIQLIVSLFHIRFYEESGESI